MFHRLSDSDTTFVGLDVHKNSITSAVLAPGSDLAAVYRFFPDEVSIKRFVGALGDPGSVVVCYEAGPTGYALARFLGRLGIACEVIAPSLIPMASGARVKTDRRDARRLVELHRVGQLTPVRISTEAEEAIGDLCRTRSDLVTDRTRARHRLFKFLLHHNVVFRDGSHWTLRHEAWLAEVRFDDEALTRTFARYRSVLSALDAELAAVENDLKVYFEQGPFAETVARLAAYRGVTELGTLALGAEVSDWARSPEPPRSWASAVSRRRSTSPVTAPSGAGSPRQPTSTSAPPSSSPPGPTSTARPPVRSSPGVRPVPLTTTSPGPGRTRST